MRKIALLGGHAYPTFDEAAALDHALATMGAIDRHLKKIRAFGGGRSFGVDYRTWKISYPQLADAYTRAARIVTGNEEGRYLPRYFTGRGESPLTMDDR